MIICRIPRHRPWWEGALHAHHQSLECQVKGRNEICIWRRRTQHPSREPVGLFSRRRACILIIFELECHVRRVFGHIEMALGVGVCHYLLVSSSPRRLLLKNELDLFLGKSAAAWSSACSFTAVGQRAGGGERSTPS